MWRLSQAWTDGDHVHDVSDDLRKARARVCKADRLRHLLPICPAALPEMVVDEASDWRS